MQCRMGCGSSKEAPPPVDAAGTALAEQRTRTQEADAVMNATAEAAAKIIQDAKRDAAEIAAAATAQAEQAATARKEVEDEYDSVLASYIATILGLKEMSVSQYVSVLREEGFDSPDDFDSLAVDELKEEPFNWKRGHILKVRVRTRRADPCHPTPTHTHTPSCFSVLSPPPPPPPGH